MTKNLASMTLAALLMISSGCGRSDATDPLNAYYGDTIIDVTLDETDACMKPEEYQRIGNTTFGRQVGLSPGERQLLLRFTSQEGPVAIGVHASASAPDDTQATGNLLNVIGLLEWGVNGGVHLAEVDIGKGTHFNLSADYVSLTARNDNPAGPNPLIANVGVRAGACIGTVDAPPATRTFIFSGLAAGASFGVAVPNFAHKLRVARADSATSLLEEAITIQLSGGTGIGVYDATQLVLGESCPLINVGGRARIATVVNTSAAPIEGALIFELAL